MRGLMWLSLIWLTVHASAEPATLQLVYPARSALKNPVNVEFNVSGDKLTAHFEVQARRVYAKANYGPNDAPFKFDVVELFLSVSGQALFPYYEFELTPLDQTLQVKIEALDRPFINGVQLGLITRVQRTPFGWIGEMEIPLSGLGWSGDPTLLWGNAFAIQGAPPNRSYWSLFLPQQKKPNFHQPQYFRPLL
jgi:hypothetical protein